MEALLNRYRNLTVLLLVIFGQLLLLAYQVKSNQDIRLLRAWAITAVTPIARVLEFVRRNTIGIAEDYFVLVHVRDENQRLGKEVGRLKMENQYLKTELQTADRAHALQAFQSRTPSRTIASRVIGNTTGTNSLLVLVDRGSNSGVMAGMAVVTPDGIVGKIVAAYPTASQVLLISDPNFAAGVISGKNRVHGTVKGSGQSKCMVDYVQNEEKVDVGEMFYTSGDDRVFPKGLPVGMATVVRPGKNSKEIYLVPAGLQNGLEEVLIIVEGVHQKLPDTDAAASNEVYLAPPAPVDNKPGSNTSAVNTDADRIRARYKKIGEVENHVYGEGLPGSKPPDFTIDPDKVKPKIVTAQPVPGQPGSAQPGSGAAGSAAAGTSAAAPRIPKQITAAGGASSAPAVSPARPIAPRVVPQTVDGAVKRPPAVTTAIPASGSNTSAPKRIVTGDSNTTNIIVKPKPGDSVPFAIPDPAKPKPPVSVTPRTVVPKSGAAQNESKKTNPKPVQTSEPSAPPNL